jgi:chromate reductase
MRVLAVAGSLRSSSLNRELLHLAGAHAPGNVQLEYYAGLKQIPAYDQDLEDLQPDSVEALKEAIASADAILVATPEYNGSIPGQLKNALDWASRPDIMTGPFWNKPVAVVSASTGSFGAVWAQQDLKRVLRTLGARVLETPELALARAHDRLPQPDDELRSAITATWAALSASAQPVASAA